MAEFLSDQWFEELNTRLAGFASSALPEEASASEMVVVLVDAPSNRPSALTLSLSERGVRVAPGESPRATTFVRLSFDDAVELTSGRLDSATALREGRIKVRGDVNALIPVATWLHTLLGD